MKRAALVVGNDSFPAHLAGTVGVPTLALMGPTLPTVFAHTPDVECLASGRDRLHGLSLPGALPGRLRPGVHVAVPALPRRNPARALNKLSGPRLSSSTGNRIPIIEATLSPSVPRRGGEGKYNHHRGKQGGT